MIDLHGFEPGSFDLHGFEPGSFGCHEALHMASQLEAAVARWLVEHPAIQLKPEWLAKAEEARAALSELYQMIGKEHL